MITANQYLNEICNCTCRNCHRFIRNINATYVELKCNFFTEDESNRWILQGVREACEHKYYQEIL